VLKKFSTKISWKPSQVTSNGETLLIEDPIAMTVA